MRISILFIVGSLTLTPAVIAQDRQTVDPPPLVPELCNSEKLPRMFCTVHQVSFEAVQVPIAYGLPIEMVDPFDVGTMEYRCRYSIARNTLFPNPSPKNVSGGCMVMEEKTEYRCACIQCTDAERRWKEAYRQRDDVIPRTRGILQRETTTIETDLFLRVQELRAFGEVEVADCLHNIWKQEFIGPPG